MTAQAPDQFSYKEHQLDLVGKKRTELTTAEDFGIQTTSASTGCWRGYIMRYAIIEKQFVIDGFWVNTRSENLPAINDVEPTQDYELSRLFSFEYKNINCKETQPKSISSEDLNDWIIKRFSLDIDVYNKKDILEANEPKMEEVKKEMLEELERLKKLKKGEE